MKNREENRGDGNCPVTNKGCVPFAGLEARVSNVEKSLDKLDRKFWAIMAILLANFGALILAIFKHLGL